MTPILYQQALLEENRKSLDLFEKGLNNEEKLPSRARHAFHLFSALVGAPFFIAWKVIRIVIEFFTKMAAACLSKGNKWRLLGHSFCHLIVALPFTLLTEIALRIMRIAAAIAGLFYAKLSCYLWKWAEWLKIAQIELEIGLSNGIIGKRKVLDVPQLKVLTPGSAISYFGRKEALELEQAGLSAEVKQEREEAMRASFAPFFQALPEREEKERGNSFPEVLLRLHEKFKEGNKELEKGLRLLCSPSTSRDAFLGRITDDDAATTEALERLAFAIPDAFYFKDTSEREEFFKVHQERLNHIQRCVAAFFGFGSITYYRPL